MLENTIVEIETSLRCKRPESLPEDIPWSESTNPEWEFAPYVYDGTMTIEDFKKVQAASLRDMEEGSKDNVKNYSSKGLNNRDLER